MPLSNSTNVYAAAKYIVDSLGSPYPTIQSAIDAAYKENGTGEIWIREGIYNENLTLYNGINLAAAENVVTINGTHTPPASGSCSLTRLTFSSATNILSSLSSGMANLSFLRCQFNLNNGYIYNLPNWTSSGSLYLYYCTDISANNGVIVNTNGTSFYMYYSLVGTGTNVLTLNGNATILYSKLECPIHLLGSGTGIFGGGSVFYGNISTADSYLLQMIQAYIDTGSAQALTHNSSTTAILSEIFVDSTNTNAIGGTGMLQAISIQFSNSYGIQNSTSLTGVTRTSEIWSDNITRLNFSGFYSWDSSGPYFDDTTIGTFQLLAGGSGYIQGLLFNWNGGQSIGVTSGSTNYIYIDNTGTIGVATAHSNSLFIDNIVLFACLRDSKTPVNNQITVKNNNPYSFPTSSSNYLYDVIGTVISNQNGGANIAANANPQSVQINGTDELLEQGLSTIISDSGGSAIRWDQMYTNSSSKWVLDQQISVFTGQWNNGGTPTNLSNNRFGVYTLYASKDNLNTINPLYFAVLNTSQYSSLANANAAIANGTTARANNELGDLGLAQLGYIVYRKSTNAIVQVTVEKSTAQQTFEGTNTAALTSTDVTNFNGVLSSSNVTVQDALDTINSYRGGLFPEVATADQTMTPNSLYVVKNATPANLTSLTLPPTPAEGDTIVISGYTVGGWKIVQNATDLIFFGTLTTTFGSSGFIQSTSSKDIIRIICVTAGGPNEWNVEGAIGSLICS